TAAASRWHPLTSRRELANSRLLHTITTTTSMKRKNSSRKGTAQASATDSSVASEDVATSLTHDVESQDASAAQLQEEAQDAISFTLPSIFLADISDGSSYTYHSPIPKAVLDDPQASVILGVDEAGRGPVLGT